MKMRGHIWLHGMVCSVSMWACGGMCWRVVSYYVVVQCIGVA